MAASAGREAAPGRRPVCGSVTLRRRPDWTTISKLNEMAEPARFKALFKQWKETVMNIDYTQTSRGAPPRYVARPSSWARQLATAGSPGISRR